MNETVQILPTGGAWGQIGADIAPGIYPGGLSLTANEWGPDTASFTLSRDGTISWNDMLPGSLVTVEREGILGWYGRVETVSADNGDGTQTVQCTGMQYHLDDDMLRPMFVQRALTSWKDWRSNLNANLATYKTDGTVEAGEGGIVLRPGTAGATTIAAYIDLGPGAEAKRVVLEWETSGFGTFGGIYLQAFNNPAGAWTNIGLIRDPALGAGSGTYVATIAGFRYVAVIANPNVAAAQDKYFRVKAARIFGDTAWESGGDSVFTLDKLAKFVLASGALPLLNQATDRIETFAFGIPELDPQRRVTPRELINIGQALHDVRIQVDVNGKLVCQVRPTSPIIETGAWASHTFKDGSTAREPIVSGVFVEGTDAAGDPMETSVASAATTLPARQGYNKRNAIPLESVSTSALQSAIGTLYNANHQTAPFKGEQVVQGWGDIRAIDGTPRHAFHTLLMTEELMRFGDRIDPDTGAIGREGRIRSVNYSATDERASLGIDNDSRKFEAMASRVAALNG